MNHTNKVKSMTIAALLCAVGIVIPMVAPKIVLEPASFTLASHVPVIIAMFISPPVAISVSLITGFGFLFAGYPIVIVLRALTHLIFAAFGSVILKKNNTILHTKKTTITFSFFISLIHAIAEVLVVTYFYWGNGMTSVYYEKGYLLSVIILVGIGTLIHSMIDFSLACFVWNPMQRIVSIPISASIKQKN